MKILVRIKGGPGSGNHGHRGIPGSVGGSAPKASVVVPVTMKKRGRPPGSKNKPKVTTVEPAPTPAVVTPAPKRGRPPGSKNKPKVTTMEPGTKYCTGESLTPIEIYQKSSREVRELANRTGIIATDDDSFAYIQENSDAFAGSYTTDQMFALKSLGEEGIRQHQQEIDRGWDNRYHRGYKATVHNAFQVIAKPEVRAGFDAANDSYDNEYTTKRQYHGTTIANARGIASTGFQHRPARVSKMLGDGLYISDVSSKVAQYAGEIMGTDPSSRGVMFALRVPMGKVKTLAKSWDGEDVWTGKKSNTIYRPGGVGTWKGITLSNPEWCVRNPTTVLPEVWLSVSRSYR